MFGSTFLSLRYILIITCLENNYPDTKQVFIYLHLLNCEHLCFSPEFLGLCSYVKVEFQ